MAAKSIESMATQPTGPRRIAGSGSGRARSVAGIDSDTTQQMAEAVTGMGCFVEMRGSRASAAFVAAVAHSLAARPYLLH